MIAAVARVRVENFCRRHQLQLVDRDRDSHLRGHHLLRVVELRFSHRVVLASSVVEGVTHEVPRALDVNSRHQDVGRDLHEFHRRCVKVLLIAQLVFSRLLARLSLLILLGLQRQHLALLVGLPLVARAHRPGRDDRRNDAGDDCAQGHTPPETRLGEEVGDGAHVLQPMHYDTPRRVAPACRPCVRCGCTVP
jgi:hypothetical protein